MSSIINNVDFENLPAEKYWSFPKTYKGDKHKDTKDFILSEVYIGAEKMDGHYARFIKDDNGNMRLQGRTESVNGGYLNKIEWVPQCMEFFNSLPNGTCLLGELYFPTKRGSRNVTTILGCLKDKALDRQAKGEKLCYYVFDVWAYNGKSLLNTPIETRIDHYLDYEMLDLFDGEDYVKKADYLKGEELWNKYGEVLASGGECIVITKLGSVPEPGKRTARKTLKCKMEIEQTIDAFVDGNFRESTYNYNGDYIESWSYWINEITGEKFDTCKYKEYSNGELYTAISKGYYYGWPSAISFSLMKDGKPKHIGYISGITEEIKEQFVKNPEEIIGKVAEISAMEIEHIGEDYSLRHAKIIQWRKDKTKEDCEWSQVE
jgi:ATP-dependent DNA ligase